MRESANVRVKNTGERGGEIPLSIIVRPEKKKIPELKKR